MEAEQDEDEDDRGVGLGFAILGHGLVVAISLGVEAMAAGISCFRAHTGRYEN